MDEELRRAVIEELLRTDGTLADKIRRARLTAKQADAILGIWELDQFIKNGEVNKAELEEMRSALDDATVEPYRWWHWLLGRKRVSAVDISVERAIARAKARLGRT